MPDEVADSSNGRSWLERISQFFDNSPTDREGLAELIRSLHDRAVIDNGTLSIIEGALEIADMQVRDVMIPRTQMVAIRASDQPKAFLPAIIESAHSRFPVLGDDPDEVLGILLAKDLLPLIVDPSRMERFDIKDHLRQALVIPEAKRLDTLLRDFRVSHNHMAMVVNEYGGIAGLVTIEDVLEQIVGEIEDEHDIEEDDYVIKQLGEHEFNVKALMPIEDFNEQFASTLSDEEFDTIGGLVLKQFGRLPERDDSTELAGLRFTVLSADSRTIKLLHVTPVESRNDTETEQRSRES